MTNRDPFMLYAEAEIERSKASRAHRWRMLVLALVALAALLAPLAAQTVRDPVTGWTFDKFREQHELNRAAVQVLTSELCQAQQQLAGTKGAV